MTRPTRLLFLIILLSLAAGCASAQRSVLRASHDAVAGRLASELIDAAAVDGTPPAERDRLLASALRLAETYSMIKDDPAVEETVRRRIEAIPGVSMPGDRGLVARFRKALRRTGFTKPRMGEFKDRVEELVEALIEKSFETGTPPGKRRELLETALDFARAYGAKTGDEIFVGATRALIRGLPPASISDAMIIEEFEKAMLHDNKVVMRLLTRRVQTRIEPLVDGIIERALEAGVPTAQKDLLLKTAMNFAKTLASITGDQAFHRSIHRRTFTARLSAPMRLSEKTGVYVVDIPATSGTTKNIFSPDNIVVQAGSTVRWVNHDEISHVIGTLDFLSDGRFHAPDIGPRGVFEHTFSEPGEYYYICYIHNSMIGKITVEPENQGGGT